MALSIDQFINEISSSGLIPAADLFSWMSSIAEADRPKTSEELAHQLVKQKKLTKFQAEQIYASQGKSLTLGNYLILDKLGQGGMGVVLKAMHRRMERIVALKVMSQTGMKSPDAVQRFHREVKAAAKLVHPNIVVAHDADEANGTHFLVMEYIEGTDLSAFVKKHGPLPVEQAVSCIIQAARGLQYAHEQGVIHRDVKPSNLLVCSSAFRRSDGTLPPEGGTTSIKILDMGLARIEGGESAQAELTTTGAVLGTVDYMAPEQALSAKSADARSDIYSLGITLWYLLTGRVAYEGDSLMAKLLAHRDAPVPSLIGVAQFAKTGEASHEPHVLTSGVTGPHAVDAVFRKMVAKQPRDRYQSMTEVIRDLERCLAGTAVIAISQPTNGDHSPETSPISAIANSVKTVNLLSAAEAETVMLPGVKVKADTHAELSLTLDEAHLPSSASGGRTNRTRLALFGSIAAALIAILAFVFSRSGQPDQRLGQVNSSIANTGISEPNNVASKATPGLSDKPSVPDFALEFDFLRHPSTRVEIPLPSLDPNLPWTLEGYIQPADIPGHNEGLPAIFEGDPWQLILSHWTLRLVEQSGSLQDEPNRTQNVIAKKLAEKWRGKRVHLAGVFDGKQAALFVDGQLIGKAPPKFLPKQHLGKLFLGARFCGRMDEWRISKVARYDNDFSPPARYEPDADTVALFHFDDGDGDRLRDSSGNNHHGEITDATWVKVNGVASGLPANGPVVRETPFVTLRNGVEAARHATLEEAFSAIQSHDVIEVHGNGPFPIGGPEPISVGVRLENVFTLKGASGFRPLFVSAPGAQQYNVGCDTARFEDVDFVLAGSAGFEFFNVRDVAFLRCRCVSTSSTPGVLLRFNCWDDPIVRFSDCFVASARREGALGFEVSPAKVEMSNTIIMTRGNPLSILAFGSTVRLNRCTIIGGSAMNWATPTNEKERSVPGTAELSRCLLFGPSYIGDHVRWQGQENVYGISQFRESGVVLPGNVKLSFDEWVKSPEMPETGSRLVSTKAKPFEEFLDQNPAVMFGRLKTYFEELRALHPDVGADPAVADGKPLQRTTTAGIEMPWTDWLGPKLKRGDFIGNRDGWLLEGDSITTDRVIQGLEVLPPGTRDAAVRVTYILRDSGGIHLTARERRTGEVRDFHYFANDNGKTIHFAAWGKGDDYKSLAEIAVPADISKDRPRTLEFRLVGDTLTLTLNGTVVVTANDSTRSEGSFTFAALKGLLIQKIEVQKLDLKSANNEGNEKRDQPQALPDTTQSPDRRAAEWVIERKGTVFVNGSKDPISSITDLPSSDFKVTIIRFHSMSLLTGMDSDLIPLRALRDLEFIDIDSDVSAAGISGLAHIPTLARFSLWGRELGNDRLAALAQIKSLEKLYLVDAKLTSEQSLTLAKSMPQLNGMSLEENKLLDDEAILPFGTMSKLASLKLNGTKVTAAGVAAMQKALPNCKIHWDGDAK